jgi:hypothetical protein
LESTVKTKTTPCGKEGDKLWITGGKMLFSEQASQLFYDMNGGKRLSPPKELLYEHCNEDSLLYISPVTASKAVTHMCGVYMVNCSKKIHPWKADMPSGNA